MQYISLVSIQYKCEKPWNDKYIEMNSSKLFIICEHQIRQKDDNHTIMPYIIITIIIMILLFVLLLD